MQQSQRMPAMVVATANFLFILAFLEDIDEKKWYHNKGRAQSARPDTSLYREPPSEIQINMTRYSLQQGKAAITIKLPK